MSITALEGRGACIIDIRGPFLKADMNTGLPVHMRLDTNMSRMMTKLAPGYERYTDAKGCVVVRLDKALHGCVESAALWYENLRASFLDPGYTSNLYDDCMFNRQNEHGLQCTIAIHVDDLLITSACPLMIEELVAGLTKRYGEITRKNGPVMNYLGMVFDLTTPGEVKVTMTGFVNEMLKECGITGSARTPATEGLFDVQQNIDTATEQQRVTFRRCVAKMLYLVKRAVSFLATRVNRCTTDDLIKLKRLMRYVCATNERGVVFSPGESGIKVRVLIDAGCTQTESHTQVVALSSESSRQCTASHQSSRLSQSQVRRLSWWHSPIRLIKHYTSGTSCWHRDTHAGRSPYTRTICPVWR